MEEGTYRVKADDLHDYLRNIRDRGGITEHEWADSTLKRVAAGILEIASDFGLLHGTVHASSPTTVCRNGASRICSTPSGTNGAPHGRSSPTTGACT